MAIYHFNSQVFTRSKGHSAVGKAAYRAAEKLHDERIEKTFDYSKKSDCFHKEIMLTKEAPKRFLDREKLWNEVEAVEKRKDAQLSREIQFSLPKELTEEQNINLTKEYVQDQFVSRGMIADVCFHKGHGKDQPHVHVMLTKREVNKDGFGQKVREWDKKALLYEQREEWANYANKHLALAGLDIKIDHRSNKERGIDLEPQKKIGANDARERYSEKVLEHKEIAYRNGEKIYNDPNVAIDALTKYKSTFTHQDIAKFINTHTVDKEQFERVYTKVKSSHELVKLGLDDRNREKFTSQEMLELEYRMVRQAQSLDNESKYGVDLITREEIIKEYDLSEEQAEAFRHVTGDRDMACIVGYAGSGKSYMLGAARESWEKEGYNIIGITLSGIAAENLEGGSGIKSYTVANRIVNWNNDRAKLSSKDVIVVDEAGMLGSRDLSRIIDEAVVAGSKVVLIGDTQQLQAIEAGAAFRGVIERVGHVDLNEIRRQKEIWQKDAIKSLALGEIGDAIGMYSKKEMVHEFDKTDVAKEAMVNDWHETVLEDKSSIMLAFTRKEVKALNTRAREVLKSYNALGIEANYDAERGKRDFAIKDRIYFLKNDKELGVKNGTLGTIKSLYSHTFEVELDKGGGIKFDIRDYNSIDHGYAATIHKSQGITVDRTFVLPCKYMNRHSTYVAMSRHKESANMYYSTDKFRSFKEMTDSLGREDRKELTLDYIKRDYQDNASGFGDNKDIEPDIKFERRGGHGEKGEAVVPENIMYFDKDEKLFNLGGDLRKELKYGIMRYNAKNEERGNYLGGILINDRNIAMMGRRGVVCYALEGVNTENVALGDEVRVMHKVDEKGMQTSELIKEEKLTPALEENNDYEHQKAKSEITKYGRKLASKENYKIDNNISTKDIYKELYHRIPSVFPEFGFERRGNCYVSTTGCKIDGSQGHKGKVYIYENNPGLLVDYTRGNKSIWDYVRESGGMRENKDIFEYLASAAGIKSYFQDKFEILREGRERRVNEIRELQSSNRENANKELATEKASITPELWQKVYEYSQNKMDVPNNQVTRYLTEERGYTKDIIPNLGIGYLPNKKQLTGYLESQGISTEKAGELIKALGVIGYSHKMVMPFYDKDGKLMGLAARNIKYDENSKYGKYVYSKGLARSLTMLGIEHINPKNPITIVEGMLDVAHAKAEGLENVVALGGAGINIRQLELIEELGIKKINLCLDNDQAGIEATKNIALQINDKNSEIEISQIKMPENIKDLDQLIAEKGVEATKGIIKNTKEINIYELTEEKEMKTLDKFQKEKDIGGCEHEFVYK